MESFKAEVLKFLREEDGLETVEYAVAGSLIVAGTVAAFTLLGEQVSAGLEYLAGKITVADA
ncbi:Flp family type IVb pilin [Aestuariicella sp. G3-2]|uniref:Flp family type IVb pilin n=1 Tax=Pseudomaricurvus albidus TaxID=2842452 RepID=UPI001C0C9A74|nr:Flp family type IVb pilin [Aestuariicella albida]MBU3071495.1 Flp family type IVb pilin [Aestuariicella albida]